MRLGALFGPSQAQLDGFKSRALRAEARTQRHLYTTEWRHVQVASGASAEVLAIGNDATVECGRLPSRVSRAELVSALRNGKRAEF